MVFYMITVRTSEGRLVDSGALFVIAEASAFGAFMRRQRGGASLVIELETVETSIDGIAVVSSSLV